jgi:FkbM family methyltransferase
MLIGTLKQIQTALRDNGLARSHATRVFVRFITLQLRTRLTGRPMLVPFVGSTQIFAGASYSGSNGNYYFGLHEFEDMAFMLHYLKPCDLFIDVGANVGSYTLIASAAAMARTIAFEPVPHTLARLRANCEANCVGSLVDIRAVCVGDKDDTVSFTVDRDTMNGVAPDNDLRPHIRVALRRLDTEISETPVAIKIDAEGNDDNVLAGAIGLLSDDKPLALLVETLGGGAFGANAAESTDRLRQFGFTRCRYDPWRRTIEETTDPPVNNHLFVRNLAFARARIESAQPFNIDGFATV